MYFPKYVNRLMQKRGVNNDMPLKDEMKEEKHNVMKIKNGMTLSSLACLKGIQQNEKDRAKTIANVRMKGRR